MNYTRETNFDYIHSLSFFSVGLVIYDDNAPSAFKQDSQTWLHFRWNGGGSHDKYDVQEGGGGIGKGDDCGQGEGGGQNSRKFCGRHLSMAPNLISKTAIHKMRR